jgi:hypothetical protein
MTSAASDLCEVYGWDAQKQIYLAAYDRLLAERPTGRSGGSALTHER